MHRAIMVVLVVALGALIFAPAAFAQDDNPTGDDLGGDDRGGERGFDDNPTGDDVMMASPAATATPTSSATSTATSTPTASATPTATATATVTSADDARPHRAKASGLPRTGGVPWLPVAAGILLVGSGITAAALARRTS